MDLEDDLELLDDEEDSDDVVDLDGLLDSNDVVDLDGTVDSDNVVVLDDLVVLKDFAVEDDFLDHLLDFDDVLDVSFRLAQIKSGKVGKRDGSDKLIQCISPIVFDKLLNSCGNAPRRKHEFIRSHRGRH